MKKILLIVILAVFYSNAQNLIIEKIEPLNNISGQNFYYPKLNPEGTKILMTSENYKGLWVYDID